LLTQAQQQQQVITARSRSSEKSRGSGKKVYVKISDAERVTYAQQLVAFVESKVSEEPYDEIDILKEYMQEVKGESVKHINKKEMNITPQMASIVLMLCLKTRPEQNVNETSLIQAADSIEQSELQELIQGQVPKQLFNLIK
jgi:hypothetical protein